MRILMMAYSCAPGSGGEPSVGWHWLIAAADAGHDVTVITRENNRPAVEVGLASLPDEVRDRITPHYHDLGRAMLFAKKRLPMFGVMTYYVLWQLAAIPLVRRLAARRPFDLAHHVTFCNDAVFSAAAFARAPFVWGPIGGWSHGYPRPYLGLLDARARLYEATRRGMQILFGVLDPLCWITRRRAALGVYYSREAHERTARVLRPRAVTAIRHVAVDEDAFAESASSRQPHEPFRLVTAGRLVHWKGFDLAIRALARARELGAAGTTLEVVGTGDQRGRLERLAVELGVGDAVRFHGHLPSHTDVLATMRASHLFVQPTLRDGPPVAMMEAMAGGVPVLAAAFGAVPELVPPEAGRVVAVDGGPDELVARLAAELVSLERDDATRSQLAEGALAYARKALTWDVVAAEQRCIYERFSR